MRCRHCGVLIVANGLYWEDEHGFAFCSWSYSSTHAGTSLKTVLRDLVRVLHA